MTNCFRSIDLLTGFEVFVFISSDGYCTLIVMPWAQKASHPRKPLKTMHTKASVPIPHVIHQTWKHGDVPPELQVLQKSWTERNPDFSYRFWTDADIARFVEDEHPELLPVFHGYSIPIARVDLARYLILRRFGGVYADLDMECLKPIEDLIAGRSFVVGLEPEEHGQRAKAVERGLPRILCPSFLASAPAHPFWDHLLARLVEARHCPDVLDATGPFLLTRAHASYEAAMAKGDGAGVTVVPPERLYPVTDEDCRNGRLFDLAFWEGKTRHAHAIHYWEGTWFRGESGLGPRLPERIAVNVTDPATPSPVPSPSAPDTDGPPLISCLMVTKGRRALVEFAIESFTRQTYPMRELVIVADAVEGPEDDALDRLVQGMGRPDIRLIRVAGPRRTLGELRNVAVDHAAGRYVCQWDDDDLYDPRRLEIQHLALVQTKARACLLGRWMMWWPAEERLAVSCERDWEGSLLCEKAVMPRYPHLRRGEDTPVVERLRRTVRFVRLDLPALYTYVVHGDNTFDKNHFEHHWAVATARVSGERCRAALDQMAKRLPVKAYRQARASRSASLPALPAADGSGPQTVRPDPTVLVLTPVKDARAHLPRYLELLHRLDHDPARLSLGLLESDSTDGTHGWLAGRLPELRERYRRVTLLRHDYGLYLDGPRWAPTVQRRRREILARSRNRLLSGALRDEAWVLWLDVDLVDYPADLLTRLLAVGRDIVVPHCVLPDGRTFDLNSFRLPDDREEEDPRHRIDGIFQAPCGVERLYLDAFQNHAMVPLDGVGGTALLVRADLHREGLCFPPYSHRGYIETEGLAMMAKDMGVTSWGLPRLRIVHGNH